MGPRLDEQPTEENWADYGEHVKTEKDSVDFVNLLELLFNEDWSVNGINKGDTKDGPDTYQVRISKLDKSGPYRPGRWNTLNGKGNGNSLLEALNAAADNAGIWDELSDGENNRTESIVAAGG